MGNVVGGDAFSAVKSTFVDYENYSDIIFWLYIYIHIIDI